MNLLEETGDYEPLQAADEPSVYSVGPEPKIPPRVSHVENATEKMAPHVSIQSDNQLLDNTIFDDDSGFDGAPINPDKSDFIFEKPLTRPGAIALANSLKQLAKESGRDVHREQRRFHIKSAVHFNDLRELLMNKEGRRLVYLAGSTNFVTSDPKVRKHLAQLFKWVKKQQRKSTHVRELSSPGSEHLMKAKYKMVDGAIVSAKWAAAKILTKDEPQDRIADTDRRIKRWKTELDEHKILHTVKEGMTMPTQDQIERLYELEQNHPHQLTFAGKLEERIDEYRNIANPQRNPNGGAVTRGLGPVPVLPATEMISQGGDVTGKGNPKDESSDDFVPPAEAFEPEPEPEPVPEAPILTSEPVTPVIPPVPPAAETVRPAPLTERGAPPIELVDENIALEAARRNKELLANLGGIDGVDQDRDVIVNDASLADPAAAPVAKKLNKEEPDEDWTSTFGGPKPTFIPDTQAVRSLNVSEGEIILDKPSVVLATDGAQPSVALEAQSTGEPIVFLISDTNFTELIAGLDAGQAYLVTIPVEILKYPAMQKDLKILAARLVDLKLKELRKLKKTPGAELLTFNEELIDWMKANFEQPSKPVRDFLRHFRPNDIRTIADLEITNVPTPPPIEPSAPSPVSPSKATTPPAVKAQLRPIPVPTQKPILPVIPSQPEPVVKEEPKKSRIRRWLGL